MSDKEKESKNKSKAVALAMAVSMVVANPLFTTGCERKEPKIVVDQEQFEEEQEQEQAGGGGSSSYIFTGRSHTSPFIFHSTTTNTTSGINAGDSSSYVGWKSWTKPSSSTTIKSGSYSGVRASSFSS
ncbi:hypothetical protein NBE98_02095 [Clostridium swellfunianum]|uniref:hypothetical protein n=1 Tax=Clostridium swellfunianum TaxID=1367462 RepID=UPI00202F12FC|nr:hypothetical protein [Clostridium swellfunianum]MCM0647163.1 hypothetical protein [Clostridium swellfunianum]